MRLYPFDPWAKGLVACYHPERFLLGFEERCLVCGARRSRADAGTRWLASTAPLPDHEPRENENPDRRENGADRVAGKDR